MEKRDIIIIIVAIFIVLLMAMYVKPLVTGKPVQLMPDEISNMLKGDTQSATNNTSLVNSSAKHVTSLPKVTSISPQNLTADGNVSKVVIEGKNFSESMDSVTFVRNGENKTFSTYFQNGTLVTDNVTLSEGNWIVKIVDNYTKITYNTTRSVVVKPTITPVPTWDGKPIPLQVTEQSTGTIFKSRPYPEDLTKNATLMKTYSNFSDINSAKIKSIYIPYGYFDIVYSVNFQTHVATPADTDKNVFEFNREYKEPLIVYEVKQSYNNETKQWDYTYTKNESDTEFKPSSDKILTKTPKDEGWTAGSGETPFDTEITDYFGQPLVESVGYTKPDITITAKNLDNPSSIPVIIKPNGGIDPLQWNEAKHKDEAEKLMKEKGKQDYFDSDEYKDAWDKKWKTIKDPRPWSERVYGNGNYSLEIDTQSIDSYNIQIKVPEARNTSYIPKMDEKYILEQNEIKKQLSKFFNGFNENLSTTYFTNISDYLVPELTTLDKIQQIYQDYVQTRATGVKVTDVVIDDIFIRGNIGKDNSLVQAESATVRGNMKLQLNSMVKTIPFDLAFVKEDSGWKLSTLPDIRF